MSYTRTQKSRAQSEKHCRRRVFFSSCIYFYFFVGPLQLGDDILHGRLRLESDARGQASQNSYASQNSLAGGARRGAAAEKQTEASQNGAASQNRHASQNRPGGGNAPQTRHAAQHRAGSVVFTGVPMAKGVGSAPPTYTDAAVVSRARSFTDREVVRRVSGRLASSGGWWRWWLCRR